MKNMIVFVVITQTIDWAQGLECYYCSGRECDKPKKNISMKTCTTDCCWSKRTPPEGVTIISVSGDQESHFSEKSCCTSYLTSDDIRKMCFRLLENPKVVHCYSCNTNLCNGEGLQSGAAGYNGQATAEWSPEVCLGVVMVSVCWYL